MIRLNEVAKKLQDILNGVDQEVIDTIPGLEPPTGFLFNVQTEGFHLDYIADAETGKNFVPVFISSMGGQFNPVPELMQANYVIPITFYFPVRFKNDLLKLNEYLARVFVGRQLNYGPNSGTALSNTSVAQFGELTEVDVLKQYKQWVQTNYKQTIEVMEPYLSMTISLYLSTVASDYIYGNDVVSSLSYELEINGETVEFEDNNLTFVQNAIQSSSDPAPQQLMGESQAASLPTSTSYGMSFTVSVKKTPFYKHLIQKWMNGESQEITLELTTTIGGDWLTFSRNVFIQSCNLVMQKGELITITFSFAKKLEVED